MDPTNGNFNPREPRGLTRPDGTRFVMYQHLAETLAAATGKSMTQAELLAAATPAVAAVDPEYARRDLPDRARLFFVEAQRRREGTGGSRRDVSIPYPVRGGGIVFGPDRPGGVPTLRFDPNGTRFR